MEVTITINGEPVTRDVEPRQLLVHFIRETPGLTGTHWGCDTSNCGACVVLMDGKPVKSCTTLAAMCEGHEIRTVESLEVDGRARPDPAGLPREARAPVRLLHAGDADDHAGAAGREPGPDRAGDPHRDLRRDLPVHRLQEHRRRGPLGRRARSRDADRRYERWPSPRTCQPRAGAADRLRPAEAQGGRALHPRQGQLPRRHPAAGDGARRDPAQPVRARQDRLDRHLGGARASRTSPR